MTEIWRPIPNFDKRYEVSNKERLRNIMTDKIMTGVSKKIINNQDKLQHMFFSKIVALAFIPNPDNLPIVVHINGTSNVPGNLKWGRRKDYLNINRQQKDNKTTPVQRLDQDDNVLETYIDTQIMIKWIRDNCQLKTKNDESIRKNISKVCTGERETAYGYSWKYEFQEIEGEEWKKHPDDRFSKLEFSTEGRCKEKNRLIVGHTTNTGYVQILIDNNYLHRLIAQTFIPNPDNLSQVDHINGIKTDNRVCNLRCCSSEQNTEYACGQKVYQYSEDKTQLINTFESVRKASRETKINRGTIINCIADEYEEAGGYWWTHTPLPVETERSDR